jgi:hypothetical protein
MTAVVGSAGRAGGAAAGTILVPGDHPSVLGAVDAAAIGDSVLVGPGTWSDWAIRTIPVDGVPTSIQAAAFLKPGVTLIGTGGPGATILDGGPEVGVLVTVVHYVAGVETTRVEGMTITGSADAVGAVAASPLVLRNCRVVQNPEVAISIREQSLTLIDCTVSDNDDIGLGGALDGIDADVVCIRTRFERNGWNAVDLITGGAGGNSLVMRDCVVADHRNRGVRVWDASSVEIEGCLFLRNFVSFSGGGGGLQLLRVTTGAIRFSTFAFDSAGGGGGVDLGSSPVSVEGCTFYGCHGDVAGGAIQISGGTARAPIFNNVITASTGQRGAIYMASGVQGAGTGCNLFWENEGGDFFGTWNPVATDILEDPLLCDPLNGDYSLSESSPAAAANSSTCGQIGAFGVGCGAVSVESTSWGRLKSLYRSISE